MDCTNPNIPRELHKEVSKYKMDLEANVPEAYERVLRPGLAVTKDLENDVEEEIKSLADENNTTKSETISNLVKKGLKEVKNE